MFIWFSRIVREERMILRSFLRQPRQPERKLGRHSILRIRYFNTWASVSKVGWTFHKAVRYWASSLDSTWQKVLREIIGVLSSNFLGGEFFFYFFSYLATTLFTSSCWEWAVSRVATQLDKEEGCKWKRKLKIIANEMNERNKRASL